MLQFVLFSLMCFSMMPFHAIQNSSHALEWGWSDQVLFHAIQNSSHALEWGWSGVAKVSYILRHWGVQLILAYSGARPAILVAGKGRGRMFLFPLFFHFIPVPLSSLSFSFISSSISFLPFSVRRHKMTHKC